MKNVIGILLAAFLLTSCTASVDDYETTLPKFELDRYFDGRVIAWGMVQDYSDQVTRRFCVDMTGTWEQQGEKKVGVLDEYFYYEDGSSDRRVWNLTKDANGRYTGTAGDVDGVASGKAKGFAFSWQYYLNLDIGDNNYTFYLDDWMYQLDEYRLMNKTAMKKFGITVAEITIFFDKQAPLRGCQND